MARTLIYVAAGVILGLVVHLVIILTLPRIAQNSAYLQVASIGLNTTTLIEKPAAGSPNPLRLDPDLAYAVCRLDLSSGPGEVTGTLPLAFWSVAVYDHAGTVLYST